MKKIMYLLVAGTLFIFTACNSGTGGAATEESDIEEVVVEEAAVEEVVEDTTATEEAEATEEATEETAE